MATGSAEISPCSEEVLELHEAKKVVDPRSIRTRAESVLRFIGKYDRSMEAAKVNFFSILMFPDL